MKFYIGVDVGGMSVKTGLVNENGVLVEKKKTKTNTEPEIMVDNIAKDISALLKNNNLTEIDIKGIGVGVPGTVNKDIGEVEFCDNLGWENIQFVKLLKAYYQLPIILGNDANAAILGEVKFGCAKKFKNVIMITLGTGVGGGIVIDGKLYEGTDGKGGELGHMTLVKDGEQCNCGRKGCFERYASASALMKNTKEKMLLNKNSKLWDEVNGDITKIDGSVTFKCAKENDETAISVVNDYVSYLCEGIISLINIFRPEAFIIGGGVSAAGEFLLNKVKTYCAKENYGYKGAPIPEILIASLGNDAGIIGAAALV